MDTLINLLVSYGLWGLLAAAYLAGTFVPFPSEAVLVGLQTMHLGLDPWEMVIFATIGNVLGGMTNYGVGRLGKLEWIERWFRVSPQQLEKAQRVMGGWGAWAGLLAVLPFVGGPVTIALGLMRANFLISTVSMTISKFLRYVILMYGVSLFVS